TRARSERGTSGRWQASALCLAATRFDYPEERYGVGGREAWWCTMSQVPPCFSNTFVPRTVEVTASPPARRASNCSEPTIHATLWSTRTWASCIETETCSGLLAKASSQCFLTASHPERTSLLAGGMARTCGSCDQICSIRLMSLAESAS